MQTVRRHRYDIFVHARHISGPRAHALNLIETSLTVVVFNYGTLSKFKMTEGGWGPPHVTLPLCRRFAQTSGRCGGEMTAFYKYAYPAKRFQFKQAPRKSFYYRFFRILKLARAVASKCSERHTHFYDLGPYGGNFKFLK